MSRMRGTPRDSIENKRGTTRTQGGGVQYKRMENTGSECWDSDVVVGKCSAYCPARELKLRVRERLLSRYEVGGEGLRPVKEYSRPAAGQSAPSSDTVRTPDTLVNCVMYLVREVVVPRLSIKEELLELYDFVFDRLRAVRQDMTVQRMEGTVCMDILNVCVRFHLLFAHLLSTHPSFSHHINTSHQLDCVKSFLILSAQTDHEHSQMMESVYLLSNMDSPSAMSWATTVHQPSKQLKQSLALAHAYQQGNYVRFYRMVSTLPLILMLSCAKYCQLLSEHALSVFSKGYKAKNARYPLSHLAELLWLSTTSLSQMLSYKGILVQDEFVLWSASNNEQDNQELMKAEYCHHEQMDVKLMEMKDQLAGLLLG